MRYQSLPLHDLSSRIWTPDSEKPKSSIWHIFRNTFPEITPLPPSTLPIPRTCQTNLVANPRITVYVIEQILRRLDKRCNTTCRIQIQQNRLLLIPDRPVDVTSVLTRSRYSAISNTTLRVLDGNHWRISRNEVAPNLAKRALKARSRRGCAGPEGLQIVTMVRG